MIQKKSTKLLICFLLLLLLKAQVSDSIRKIRTTARFLLGNLHDFSYKDCVPYDQLKEVC